MNDLIKEREQLLASLDLKDWPTSHVKIARALLTIPSHRKTLQEQLLREDWLRAQVLKHVHWINSALPR